MSRTRVGASSPLLVAFLSLPIFLIGLGLLAVGFLARPKIETASEELSDLLQDAKLAVGGLEEDLAVLLAFLPELENAIELGESTVLQSRTLVAGLQEAGRQLSVAMNGMATDLRTLETSLRTMLPRNQLQQTADQLEGAANSLSQSLPAAEALLVGTDALQGAIDAIGPGLQALQHALATATAPVRDVSTHLDSLGDTLSQRKFRMLVFAGVMGLGALIAVLGLCLLLLANHQLRVVRALREA